MGESVRCLVSWRRTGAAVLVLAALLIAPEVGTTVAGAEMGPAQQAARDQLPVTYIRTPAGDRAVASVSGGVVTSARDSFLATHPADAAAAATAPTPGAVAPSQLGISPLTQGCSQRNSSSGGGRRVNQDCTFRRQAEELIKFNPIQPNNLIAGQNDARTGFNKCGFDYSFDAGTTWGDGQPPFLQKLNNPNGELPVAGDPNRHTILGGPGTGHTYDAFSDPALAFDSQGRAFFSCVGFDINDSASSLLVTASPAGAGGSFYNNVGTNSRRYVVADDNNGKILHDKQFIAADFYASSPNRDNVYVTWTVFRFSAKCGPQPNPAAELRECASPIFGSMSTDHARTWSTPQEISGRSSALCFFGNFFDPTLPANSCDIDQGSDLVVLPDGRLSVVFFNQNTAANNPNNQQLAVSCSPTGSSFNGTARLNCGSPSLVGRDVSLNEPNCDFGRGPEECIPGAFIRTNDFPRLAVNRDNGQLYAVWQDYRNNEFDVQLASSADGGLTWSGAASAVNPDPGKDHYFPAIDVSSSPQGGRSGVTGTILGDHVGVSYFRTDRVPGEFPLPTGPFAPGQPGVQAEDSDYVLAGGRSLATPYRFQVVSPSFPPPDGIQGGFNGDYSGLVVVDSTAHPIWSDTRNAVPAGADPQEQGVVRDEDVFTTLRGLP
ncbi:MAG: hypothetical protein M3083_12970 [Actinomycetota bacterium]|nr:hypothetical protein [Actinomycetota bacterium]